MNDVNQILIRGFKPPTKQLQCIFIIVGYIVLDELSTSGILLLKKKPWAGSMTHNVNLPLMENVFMDYTNITQYK